LSVRVLPEGCAFSHKGPVIFADPGALPSLLAITNCIAFQSFVRLHMAFGSYEVGVIQRTPVPNLTSLDAKRLSGLALECVEVKRQLDTTSETSHIFHLPALLQNRCDTLAIGIRAWQSRLDQAEQTLTAHQQEIDDLAFQLYTISGEDRCAMQVGQQEQLTPESEEGQTNGAEGDEDQAEPTANAPNLVSNLLSYTLGGCFGRWDVRFGTGDRKRPELSDPFHSLSVCSPGMLTSSEGWPSIEAPPGYPLHIAWDGIIPDDADHPDDIIRRVREGLELIWKDRAEAIEKEACEILGVKELRDYFRKPGKGGFWDDHVSRYSKSRRKAPIYWLLQSSKKNYAFWLYYHRLDKDILFKALLNYIEPKVRLEQSRLDTLRAQRSALGDAAKGAKKIDKDIERQEALLGEIKDFEEKLRRAANLDFGKNLDSSVIYDPDLNDGVVLNIAPLWELVPWKEAKGYWDELLAGEYEWSSMGKLLRKKGLVK
jgi:hypothetical protein